MPPSPLGIVGIAINPSYTTRNRWLCYTPTNWVGYTIPTKPRGVLGYMFSYQTSRNTMLRPNPSQLGSIVLSVALFL